MIARRLGRKCFGRVNRVLGVASPLATISDSKPDTQGNAAFRAADRR